MIRHSERARRRTLLLVLLLLLGSLGARALHWIATPHRMCEIHGTVEHETLTAQDSEGPPAGPAYRSAGRTHEECSLGPCLRSEALALQDTRVTEAFRQRESAAQLPHEPLPERTRHGLAPSRSPPV